MKPSRVVDLDRLETSTVAITVEQINLLADEAETSAASSTGSTLTSG